MPRDRAIVVPDGPELTYGTLRAQVYRVAETLGALGFGRDDRIALVLPNGAEAVVAFLGVAAVATAAPLNPAYTEEEFRFSYEDTGARAVIVPRGGAEAARRAMSDGMVLIEVDVDPDGSVRVETSAPRRAAGAPPEPRGDDVALVLHTSGTTSRPKRVPLRHRNVVASAENIVATYALRPDDVSLCVMPLFHVHGLVASTLATLRSGGTVVMPRRFNPLGFWALVKAHAVTWYSAVPTVHQLVLVRSGADGRPSGAASLRFVRSCSAALHPNTWQEMERRFGVPVLEAYGMTEAAHQIASNPLPPGVRKAGSVGRGTGVQIAVVDEGGTVLPPGAQGEVVVRGPNVIDGYENNPEANASAFVDGWFRTGDLGVLDAEGYLTLHGRIKELIKRGGEQIAPREVDEVLLSHPAVEAAVCFGVPHEVWGEEVAAAVVLRAPATEAELVRHCRQHLAEFKVPKKIYVVDELPRTATGKLQRRHVAAAMGVLG
ncbi:MAG TPA: acyl--CoA ligase [Chloroflexota bacterium]